MNSLNKRTHKGFTLIELMITVAIIGILASVTYPSYVDFIRVSDRSEAQRQLLVIANLQEQFFLDQRQYTDDLTDLGLTADPFITESGNYSIAAIINNDADIFTLTATAQGSQAKDVECLTFSVDNVGRKTATSATCWER